jgi:hypothetical protein
MKPKGNWQVTSEIISVTAPVVNCQAIHPFSIRRTNRIISRERLLELLGFHHNDRQSIPSTT